MFTTASSGAIRTVGNAETSGGCLDKTIGEHFDNASQFLVGLRTSWFLLQSHGSSDALCRRCEANLDALRITGEKAVSVGKAAMEDHCEAASVVALLLAESEWDQPVAAEQAVALLLHESPEIRQAAWWGLRLASSLHVEPHLRALLGKPKWDFASAAALAILALHRLPVQADLGAPPDEEGDEIAWLLADARRLERDARETAPWTCIPGRPGSRLARLGPVRTSRMSHIVSESGVESVSSQAAQHLSRVGAEEDLSLLCSGATTAQHARRCLGRLGLPSVEPHHWI